MDPSASAPGADSAAAASALTAAPSDPGRTDTAAFL